MPFLCYICNIHFDSIIHSVSVRDIKEQSGYKKEMDTIFKEANLYKNIETRDDNCIITNKRCTKCKREKNDIDINIAKWKKAIKKYYEIVEKKRYCTNCLKEIIIKNDESIWRNKIRLKPHKNFFFFCSHICKKTWLISLIKTKCPVCKGKGEYYGVIGMPSDMITGMKTCSLCNGHCYIKVLPEEASNIE